MEDNQALALWYFIKECNFKCTYCKIGKANADKSITRRIRKKIKKRFRELTNSSSDPLKECIKIIKLLKNDGEKKWSIGLTGGEPFIYPHFVQLCQLLTEHFSIYVDTNLSITERVKEFAKKISPERVHYFYISTHIAEREKRNQVENFIRNMLVLKEYGFNYRVNYVLQPTLIERFMKDYDYFKSRGVTIIPKPLRGTFQGKRYPQDHTDQEKRLLLKYNPDFYDVIPIKSRGMKCDAGKSFVRITPDGKVMRCVGDQTVLGHISSGIRFNKEAEPCKIDTCPCFGQQLLKNH